MVDNRAYAPQPARQQKPIIKPLEIEPDYISIVKEADNRILQETEDNPIYDAIIEKKLPKEEAITKVYETLVSGLEDDTVTDQELDDRRSALAGFNAFMQSMRRQLGAEQAKSITDKTYADFQRILNVTATDAQKFEDQLTPLNRFSVLFAKYGSTGNIIENLNKARVNKIAYDKALAKWKMDHDDEITTIESAITNINYQIADKKSQLREKQSSFFSFANAKSRLQLEADISQLENDLNQRKNLLSEANEKTSNITNSEEVEVINPEILELQDLGGEAFKAAITKLREETDLTLAKMSSNFDEAIASLTNSKTSFINMDRNCSDANIALSILEIAVQRADKKAKEIAVKIIAEANSDTDTSDMAKLNRMEKEARSQRILAYSGDLSTFIVDIGIAITSIRSGQTVIQSILRMNATALQSANTHKMTGIANTSDAVTIIIGGIIDSVSRAASRVLRDGLTKIRTLAQEGNQRLAEGAFDSLKMQNDELQDIVTTVQELESQAKLYSVNSVDLIKKGLNLVAQMQLESNKLGETNTEANRLKLAVISDTEPTTGKKADTKDQTRGFSLRR